MSIFSGIEISHFDAEEELRRDELELRPPLSVVLGRVAYGLCYLIAAGLCIALCYGIGALIVNTATFILTRI